MGIDPSGQTTLLDAAILSNERLDEAVVTFVGLNRPDIPITRRQFQEQLYRRAALLKSCGVAPNDLILIAETQRLEALYTFWAVILAGGIPSMFPTLTEKLNPTRYQQDMAALVELSQPRAVIAHDDFAALLAETVGCEVWAASQLETTTQGVQTAVSTVMPSPEQVVLLQHSSGTTGLQKGVALSHEAVLNQLSSYAQALNLQPDDVVVSWLPLYHDMGLIAGFLLPLVCGIPLVLMSPFEWVRKPAMLLTAISQHQGTLCWLPNFAYNHCARRVRKGDLDGVSLSSLRLLINCSEPVRADSHAQFVARFAPYGMTEAKLAVSYAMAENVFAVTQTPAGRPIRIDTIDSTQFEETQRAVPVPATAPNARAIPSCGIPIDGTQIRVVWDGQDCPERVIGEIWLQSNCLLTGYYRRPELQPFHDGWYATGDMGYMAEGELFVIGRQKEIIINAGKNVYPQDIEVIVNEVDGIHPGRVLCFGVPDEREGTELIGIVAEVDFEDEEGKRATGRLLRQAVATNSMVTVSYVRFVGAGWLIKTSSGKVARPANRERALALI